MRIHELFSFALQYLKLGVVLAILFLLVQWFIKKHITHTTISMKSVFCRFVFIVYFIVLLCATLARSGYEQVVKLQPFSSYMAAWNHASASEWRNLLINILLFIPLGFLLPILSAKWEKCWKTYICGAIIALFIECMQFTFHRGIVEFDDFLNNTLGTAIGYGFWQIINSAITAVKHKTSSDTPLRMTKRNLRNIRLVLYQIPLAVVITSYIVFFISYSSLQLGTLSCKYSEVLNMSKITVESQCVFNNNDTEDYVYKGTLLSEEESASFATDYFQNLNDELDESQNDIYENIAVYKSNSMRYILSVAYRGGGYELTDFGSNTEDETSFSSKTCGLSAEKIKGLLRSYHVTIPNKATFTELENGEYQFAIHMTKEGDYWYDGTCIIIPAKDRWISHLNYNILCFSNAKIIHVISEQQAYENLRKGKFVLPDEIDTIADITNICVNDITIDYEIDNKGYAQPVYTFHTIINHNKNKTVNLKIPAVHS